MSIAPPTAPRIPYLYDVDINSYAYKIKRELIFRFRALPKMPKMTERQKYILKIMRDRNDYSHRRAYTYQISAATQRAQDKRLRLTPRQAYESLLSLEKRGRVRRAPNEWTGADQWELV